MKEESYEIQFDSEAEQKEMTLNEPVTDTLVNSNLCRNEIFGTLLSSWDMPWSLHWDKPEKDNFCTVQFLIS